MDSDKRKIIREYLKKGHLVSPEFIESLEKKSVKDKQGEDNLIGERNEEPPCYSEGRVVILKNYKEKFKKRSVEDFVSYFRNRFEGIKNILINRPELQNLISINKLKTYPVGKEVSVMGLVSEKSITKTGNIILIIEDITGKVKVVVSKNKKETYDVANELVLDEVVGIKGSSNTDIIFVNEIYHPDIPSNQEIKKSPDESYCVFTGDSHFGLSNFLEKDFKRFISWLKGEYGNEEQRKISNKVKYLFIAGDLVEGIGIYPNQDKDLVIDDIKKQYAYAAELLSEIPKRVKIIICPGNHDAMRISEPQLIFDGKYAQSLFELENVFCVTNPSLINIHSSKDFPGFNVLLYHGFSFPYYAENVDSIRSEGGIARPDLIMKFL